MTAQANPDSPAAPSNRITVLLVDDSSVIRGALVKILEANADIEVVGSVMNGEIGIQKAEQLKPDIVILDVEMPVMDGITALPQILRASTQSKVIMFSSLTEKGAEISMKALSLGAVECFAKPSASQDISKGSEFQEKLLKTIRGLAPHKKQKPHTKTTSSTSAQPQPVTSEIQLKQNDNAYTGKPDIIVIGSSTGGPQALFNVLKHCKNVPVPILITQHMPPMFTKLLAQHITQNTDITAQEGAQDMVIEPGKIYVAPGGRHMEILNKTGSPMINLLDTPPINFCKPSVDPMFESVAKLYGSKILGVILTGMGSDGLDGGHAIVNAGGRLIAQNQETSTVWGMPKAVAEAGICSAVLPLDDIGPWIKDAAPN